MRFLAALIWTFFVVTSAASFALAEPSSGMSKPVLLDRSKCKTPVARFPSAREWPVSTNLLYTDYLQVDFTGDGWCDLIAVLGEPVNVKSSWLMIEEILRIGAAKSWHKVRPPVDRFWKAQRGMPPAPGEGKSIELHFDASQVVFLDVGSGSPPMLIGVRSVLFPDEHFGNCSEHRAVFQWQEKAGTFLRIEPTKEKEVLNYFYTNLAKPCPRK